MALINSVTFVVLKILRNLVSMRKSLNSIKKIGNYLPLEIYHRCPDFQNEPYSDVF